MPPSRKNELADISGEIKFETEKAYRFYDGARTEWVPKSLGQWDSESKVMTMPMWLAEEKGFV